MSKYCQFKSPCKLSSKSAAERTLYRVGNHQQIRKQSTQLICMKLVYNKTHIVRANTKFVKFGFRVIAEAGTPYTCVQQTVTWLMAFELLKFPMYIYCGKILQKIQKLYDTEHTFEFLRNCLLFNIF